MSKYEVIVRKGVLCKELDTFVNAVSPVSAIKNVLSLNGVGSFPLLSLSKCNVQDNNWDISVRKLIGNNSLVYYYKVLKLKKN